jgi:hypothetical protein
MLSILALETYSSYSLPHVVQRPFLKAVISAIVIDLALRSRVKDVNVRTLALQVDPILQRKISMGINEE